MVNGKSKAEQMRREFLDELNESIRPLLEAADATESPIEEMMLWALLKKCEGWGVSGLPFPWADYMPCDFLPGGAPQPAGAYYIQLGDELTLIPQVEVLANGTRYRIDIGVTRTIEVFRGHRERVCVAVECDGHDFHERTKEQAERDKARDRDLQTLGWHVARFTGSEIFRDPEAAAEKVWKMSSDLMQQASERVARIRALGKPRPVPKSD